MERIESLFTQLEAGVAALKRAQAALKRYKASVLKAACEGRLVPQDDADDEPAEVMLRRMGKEPLVGEVSCRSCQMGGVGQALISMHEGNSHGENQNIAPEMRHFFMSGSNIHCIQTGLITD